VPCCDSCHRAPEAPTDLDWTAHRGAQAQLARDIPGLASRMRVVVDPGRTTCAKHERDYAVPLEAESSLDRQVTPSRPPGRDDGRVAVVLVAMHPRALGTQELAHLPG